MNALSIYKDLSSLKMTEDEMVSFVKGYKLYLALTSRGWRQTPCRLVYRKPKTLSMVVLPFFIPELEKLIWGIEIEGVYMCINAQTVKELYPGFVMAKMYGDCSVFWGTFDQAKERPFRLPTVEEFHRWNQKENMIRSTLMVLRKGGLSVQMLQQSCYVKTSSCESQQVAEFRKFETKSTIESSLRYVLTADDTRDIFCPVNRFGVPDGTVLRKCLKDLNYTLPQKVYNVM